MGTEWQLAGDWLQERRWACDACSNPYDLGEMEARLVSIVQGRARTYQLQDLKCSKCRRVGTPFPIADS